MGGVATPVIISGQSKLFRDNQRYSGTIWAKADFRDPSGTQVRNSGLSRRFDIGQNYVSSLPSLARSINSFDFCIFHEQQNQYIVLLI